MADFFSEGESLDIFLFFIIFKQLGKLAKKTKKLVMKALTPLHLVKKVHTPPLPSTDIEAALATSSYILVWLVRQGITKTELKNNFNLNYLKMDIKYWQWFIS